jgi:hypothetical protein
MQGVSVGSDYTSCEEARHACIYVIHQDERPYEIPTLGQARSGREKGRKKRRARYQELVGWSHRIARDRRLQDNLREREIFADALVRKDDCFVDVEFCLDGDVFAKNRKVFDTDPLADGRVPSNDGG